MTASPAQGIAGSLPVVSTANEPAAIRNGSPAVQHSYQEALGFEEMLLEELTHSLAATGGLGGEGGEGEEGEAGAAGEEASEGSGAAGAGSSVISSMMPRSLAEGVVAGGGIGLAAQMAEQLGGGASSTGAPAGATSAGGTSAGAVTGPAGATASTGASVAGGTAAPGETPASGDAAPASGGAAFTAS